MHGRHESNRSATKWPESRCDFPAIPSPAIHYLPGLAPRRLWLRRCALQRIAPCPRFLRTLSNRDEPSGVNRRKDGLSTRLRFAHGHWRGRAVRLYRGHPADREMGAVAQRFIRMDRNKGVHRTPKAAA